MVVDRMKDDDTRYGIYVDRVTFMEYEKAREKLGLSQINYLRNLMGKDFTVTLKFKRVDLNQTRLYTNEDLKVNTNEIIIDRIE